MDVERGKFFLPIHGVSETRSSTLFQSDGIWPGTREKKKAFENIFVRQVVIEYIFVVEFLLSRFLENYGSWHGVLLRKSRWHQHAVTRWATFRDGVSARSNSSRGIGGRGRHDTGCNNRGTKGNFTIPIAVTKTPWLYILPWLKILTFYYQQGSQLRSALCTTGCCSTTTVMQKLFLRLMKADKKTLKVDYIFGIHQQDTTGVWGTGRPRWFLETTVDCPENTTGGELPVNSIISTSQPSVLSS